MLLALAAVPGLLGMAAAQPVVETTRRAPERTDAQAFVVVDVSRSMLAAGGPGAPTRFERARDIALELRESAPEVPFGVASITDRVLPHLFPTTDAALYASTLRRALDVEQPPPGAFYLTHATNLNSLRALPEKGYFPALGEAARARRADRRRDAGARARSRGGIQAPPSGRDGLRARVASRRAHLRDG